MNCLDCCSSITCCDCCCSITCCDCCSDCCSVDCGCCSDCYGAGFPFGGINLGEGLAWDGNTLRVTLTGGSNCTCQPYELPTASESVKGGIKIGHSLMMIGDTLNVALDTVPSTVEGFIWIHDIVTSVSGGESVGFGTFTKEDVDDIFKP